MNFLFTCNITKQISFSTIIAIRFVGYLYFFPVINTLISSSIPLGKLPMCSLLILLIDSLYKVFKE